MEFKVVVILSFLLCICNGYVFGPSTQSDVEADRKEMRIQSDINILKDNIQELLKRVSKNANEIASLKRENQYLRKELENKRRKFSCEINVLHEHSYEHQQLLNDTKTEIIHLRSSTIEEIRNRVDKLEILESQRSEVNNTECIDKPVLTSCDDGWKRHTNNCYYFSTYSASWTDAKRECTQNDSRLADASSTSEIDFLKNNTAKYEKNFWLDGTDESEEGVWVWSTSGQRFNVDDWYSSEPNNKDDNEHCLEIRRKLDNQWNDEDCSSLISFICKKPLM
ncbi:C-type lectin domain family 4 member K-like [Mytilus galloprovincialis]|uniref:C-type lectin domain family 4 member K-like n=1 Tax=Mytilus galloprovincialis TaxID=29158 RepID=UPI003F7BE875